MVSTILTSKISHIAVAVDAEHTFDKPNVDSRSKCS